jgi:putative tricarboxylic transport membrane protein
MISLSPAGKLPVADRQIAIGRRVGEYIEHVKGGRRRRMIAMLREPSRIAVFALILVAASQASAADPYYKGKRLSILINFSAGGPTDVEGRLFAKHIGKHIAGQPNIIVQNMDGAGGMIGANYLGSIAPKDGTMVGYFTGTTWRYVNTPEKFRVDFKDYEFVGFQPGTSVHFARTDTPPGLKQAADILKATGVVAGGLGPTNSKDLLIRLSLDMLGVPYKYVSPYHGSAAARMALQQGEINLYAESPPSFRAIIMPNLVKTGKVIPLYCEPSYDGENFTHSSQMEGTNVPTYTEFFQKVRGKLPSGQLWDVYKTILLVNGTMQRLVVLPPNVPAAAADALRTAIVQLNHDKDYIADAMRTVHYVPEWRSGANVNTQVRRALSAKPGTREFIAAYVKKGKSLKK